MNSMSCNANPARSTIAFPSPVQVWAEDHDLGAKTMQCAVIEVPRHHPTADALIVHDQVEREVFDEKFRIVAQGLLVERVDDRVAGPVGGGTGVFGRVALTVIPHVAAKGPLVNPPVLGARKRHAEMLRS